MWVVSSLFCGCASCLVSAVCLLAEAGSRPAANRFLLSCQKKPGKENAHLAGGLSGGTRCALDKRFAQTAAGNWIFILGTRDACARVGYCRQRSATYDGYRPGATGHRILLGSCFRLVAAFQLNKGDDCNYHKQSSH